MGLAAGLQNCALQETQPCSWVWEAAPGWPVAPRVGSCAPKPWLGCPSGLVHCPRGCPCRLRPGTQPGAGARKWRTSNLWKESQACLKALQLTPGPFGTPSRTGFPEMTSQPVFLLPPCSSMVSMSLVILTESGSIRPGVTDHALISSLTTTSPNPHLYFPSSLQLSHRDLLEPRLLPPLTVALGVTCT